MKHIKLSKGRFAIVDDEDYEWLSQWNWYCGGNGYASRSQYIPKYKNKIVYMHREIMKAPSGMECDHINGDPLDNRKSNLRLCTHKQNLASQKRPKNNTSGYKGVIRSSSGKKWKAEIRIENRPVHLGTFEDPTKAAQAYDNAAQKHFGEFARLNFGGK